MGWVSECDGLTFLNSIDQADEGVCALVEGTADVSEEEEWADEECCQDDSDDEDYMPPQ